MFVLEASGRDNGQVHLILYALYNVKLGDANLNIWNNMYVYDFDINSSNKNNARKLFKFKISP